MVRSALVILFLLSISTSFGQIKKQGRPCGGMDILDVGVHIQGHEPLDHSGIRYSEISAESLQRGFTVVLADTSYKVNRFLIDHESSSGIKEYPVSGGKVTLKNAAFLQNIKPGDQFSIECINIAKGSVTSLSTSFRIIVSK